MLNMLYPADWKGGAPLIMKLSNMRKATLTTFLIFSRVLKIVILNVAVTGINRTRRLSMSYRIISETKAGYPAFFYGTFKRQKLVFGA
ncbi:hypothetical protein BC497_29445 (plasmid) [Klebsiella variicola]|nr:hypothetical protein BC497_29445 [Klebsiella variicola]